MKKMLKVTSINNGMILEDSKSICSYKDLPPTYVASEGDYWLVSVQENGEVELLTQTSSESIYVEEQGRIYEYKYDSEPIILERKGNEDKETRDMEQFDFGVIFQSNDILEQTFVLEESEHILESGVVITTQCQIRGHQIIKKCLETNVVKILPAKKEEINKFLETIKSIDYKDGYMDLGKGNYLKVNEYELQEIFPDISLHFYVRPNDSNVYGVLHSNKLGNTREFICGEVNGIYNISADGDEYRNKIIPPPIKLNNLHPTLQQNTNIKYFPLGESGIAKLVLRQVEKYIDSHADPDINYVDRMLYSYYIDTNGRECYPIPEKIADRLMIRIHRKQKQNEEYVMEYQH